MSIGRAKLLYVCACMFVSGICAEGIFCAFSLVTKNVKSRSKIALFFFQMHTILKFDFQKRKQLHFTEENYLYYTKKTPLFM